MDRDTTDKSNIEENEDWENKVANMTAEERGVVERLDELLGYTKAPMVVAQHKRKNERDMRNTKRAMNAKKRQDTLYRASQPRIKQNKPRKRHKGNSFTFVKPPPESQWEEDLRAIRTPQEGETEKEVAKRKELAQIFKDNYDAWISNKLVNLGTAKEADDELVRENERKKRRDDTKKIKNKHRSEFAPSLKLIDPDHGKGEKIRSSNSSSKTAKKISSFFGVKAGNYQKQVEREYSNFYYEHVTESLVNITAWPVFKEEQEEEEPEQSKIKSEMTCPGCSNPLYVDGKTASMSCLKCGQTVAGGEGVGMQQTFAEQQSSVRSAAPYERIAHVSFLFMVCCLG